jgi:hypothetical protein
VPTTVGLKNRALSTFQNLQQWNKLSLTTVKLPPGACDIQLRDFGSSRSMCDLKSNQASLVENEALAFQVIFGGASSDLKKPVRFRTS